MLELICPDCRRILLQQGKDNLYCPSCYIAFPVLNNQIVSFMGEKRDKNDVASYQMWQGKVDEITAKDIDQKQIRQKNKFFLCLKDFFSKYIKPNKTLYLLFDYFSIRKEFFFKDFLNSGHRGIILDIGCGRGSELLTEFGDVIGVDFNINVLIDFAPKQAYNLLIHSGVLKLPFKDEQFDYIVSSDFLEHVPLKDKSAFYREMWRILKKNGLMAHFVTTDSNNFWFRFAHRYPDLFKKYLIDEIGNHDGLELPDQLLDGIKKQGFDLISLKKMLWEPWEFVLRFDNEYKEKSFLMRSTVNTCKSLMKNYLIFMLISVSLGVICRFIEAIMPVNYSNKLGVVFKRRA